MKLPLTRKTARQAYWTTMLISIALFVTGFLIPPMGQIHPSVLYACGSLMLFTTIFIFIVSRMNITLSADIDDKKIDINATQPQDKD